ncbi:hypothetical protein PC118_g5765 [Phytophthora cactorum]|uniref:Uncharacterized protein n=1 Tax=Phytophthora cactorum TaxID=29920 RepID=A0A8T1GEM1_9STRA|nr:hypothetical protein PC118_g5765 [Phytophthora cactorum]KAG3023522.1 hypothetical protein PC119_g8872 [Phytophthora cactorum]KAG3174650.1 hypothetical protein C6341_g9742 [Phytophthora cactorum]
MTIGADQHKVETSTTDRRECAGVDGSYSATLADLQEVKPLVHHIL